MRKIVVIGGGLGGLASAIRLSANGHQVTLVEKGESLGGRARVFTVDGFEFDAGPTVLTAPSLLRALFALNGEALEDHVDLLPVAPWYRMQFDDGSHLDYSGDTQAMSEAIRTFNPDDVAGYAQLSAHADELCAVGFDALSDVPFHSLWKLISAGPAMARLRCDRSVYALVSRYLRDPRLRQAFSVHPLLVGGNPFTTTSIYSLIHSLERREGIWFPRGGMGTLVEALVALARRMGVTILTQAEATRINIKRQGSRYAATGVALRDGRTFEAERVVSNADPLWVYRKLLPPEAASRWTAPKLDSVETSMGLFVVYFATKRRYPEVMHHTILFGGAFEEELAAIFKHGRIHQKFSVYLHRPSATDPQIVQANHDSFYALVAVPNLRASIDWRAEGPRLQARVFERLEATLLPGLRAGLVASHHVTPTYFRDELNSWDGAGFSLAPTFMQSAWFRPHNRGEGVDGLYFAGAGTHPGAGVPGVLQSAKIVERLITESEELRHAA
jgi:phytoene desaturase